MKDSNVDSINNDKICQICGEVFGGDNDFTSTWANCQEKECNYWVHLLCLGLKIKQAKKEKHVMNLVDFFCPIHNMGNIEEARAAYNE